MSSSSYDLSDFEDEIVPQEVTPSVRERRSKKRNDRAADPSPAPPRVRRKVASVKPPSKGKEIVGSSSGLTRQAKGKGKSTASGPVGPLKRAPAKLRTRSASTHKFSGKGSTWEFRDEDCYSRPKQSIDPRFWSDFHADYYHLVYYKMKNPVVRSQWIDWKYLSNHSCEAFVQLERAARAHGLKDLLAFRYDWNDEVITQFFATCYFSSEDGEKVTWMTHGSKYSILYTEFVKLLHLEGGEEFEVLPDDSTISKEAMKCLYDPRLPARPPSTKNMTPFSLVLNRVLRKTIAPKDGDAGNVQGQLKSLMMALHKTERFDVGHYLWNDIAHITLTPNRSCGHAPILMFLIEKVTGIEFVKDVEHTSLKLQKPPVPSLPRASSPPPAPQDDRATPPAQEPTSAPAATRRSSPAPKKGGSSSGILKYLSSIFASCRKVEVKVHKQGKALKQQQRYVRDNITAICEKLEIEPVGSLDISDDSEPDYTEPPRLTVSELASIALQDVSGDDPSSANQPQRDDASEEGDASQGGGNGTEDEETE